MAQFRVIVLIRCLAVLAYELTSVVLVPPTFPNQMVPTLFVFTLPHEIPLEPSTTTSAPNKPQEQGCEAWDHHEVCWNFAHVP